MENCKKSMLIEPNDNVAVAVEPIEAGDYTMVAGEKLTANQFIKEGHKIARVDICALLWVAALFVVIIALKHFGL